MKTGILGGTFDPIHYAHLILAETARDVLGLDRVLVVPAGIPPHKRNRRISSAQDRNDMVRAAIANVPGFEISTFESNGNGISFTYLTLRHFHSLYPDDTFVLVTGSDTLADIPYWREPAEVCRLAAPAAAHRAGQVPPDFNCLAELVDPARLELFKTQVVPMPLLEISSTDIRARVACGRSIRFLLPEAVAEIIHSRGLYLEPWRKV